MPHFTALSCDLHLSTTANCFQSLSVIVRENRAGAKDRGRCLTSTIYPYKSHMKRLSTVVFLEVGGFFMSKIKIFFKSGPSTGMKYLDFRLTFVEPNLNSQEAKKKTLPVFFYEIFSLAIINRLKYNFQYLSQFHVFHVVLNITVTSLN